MLILGLTGSIGMGKSTTANMFRDLGIDVYDSDASVHELYSKEALAPISIHFPEAVEGSLIDRKKLAAFSASVTDPSVRPTKRCERSAVVCCCCCCCCGVVGYLTLWRWWKCSSCW
jgi:hypothetical protein